MEHQCSTSQIGELAMDGIDTDGRYVLPYGYRPWLHNLAQNRVANIFNIMYKYPFCLDIARTELQSLRLIKRTTYLIPTSRNLELVKVTREPSQHHYIWCLV